MHTPHVIRGMLPDMKHIRACSAYHRCVKQRLRMAGIEFVTNCSNWGFWIRGVVNSRTGSEWHSVDEARIVLSGKRA